MRYVSLAIFGTLCLGMMLCAQTTDPAHTATTERSGADSQQQTIALCPEKSVGYVVESPAVLAGRSKPRIHRVAADLSSQVPVQGDSEITLVRGSGKQVLKAAVALEQHGVDRLIDEKSDPSIDHLPRFLVLDVLENELPESLLKTVHAVPTFKRKESDTDEHDLEVVENLSSYHSRSRHKDSLGIHGRKSLAIAGATPYVVSAKAEDGEHSVSSPVGLSPRDASDFRSLSNEPDSGGYPWESQANVVSETEDVGSIHIDVDPVKIVRTDLEPNDATVATGDIDHLVGTKAFCVRAPRKRIHKFSPVGDNPLYDSLSKTHEYTRSPPQELPALFSKMELAKLPERLPDLIAEQPKNSVGLAGGFETWTPDSSVEQAEWNLHQQTGPGQIRGVDHHEQLTDRKQSRRIADLVVGTLPGSSPLGSALPDSTRRVRLAASQAESVQRLQAPAKENRELVAAPKPAIPLQAVPTTDRASIQKTDDLVTLVATDAELRSVLRMIADHHHLNLVIGPEVAGPVTVSIRGARLDEILDAILGVAGFNWHLSGNLLYVTGAQIATLDPKVQGRRLQVYPLNYVASTDIEPVVTGLLSPVGKVYTSEADSVDQLRTRELLVVEDTEAGHQRVAQYIAQVDIQPRQVLIEAHVLRIDLGDEERYGINLRGLARIAGAKVIIEGTDFATEEPEGPSAAFRIEGSDVTNLIEAIHANTNSRTLASPKVSVVNRQTAKVQIGQRLPYAVSTTTQTATIQNVQFLDVGIVLEVTPVVTEDRNILMTVLPKVSGGKITDSGFPEEDTTQVSTTVLMPDGSGLVIGGLIREVDSDNRAEVPKLGRIPVVKYLFNKISNEHRRSELVIALVTHIMDDANPVRQKECIDLRDALPPHAASELRYSPEIRYSNE